MVLKYSPLAGDVGQLPTDKEPEKIRKAIKAVGESMPYALYIESVKEQQYITYDIKQDT